MLQLLENIAQTSLLFTAVPLFILWWGQETLEAETEKKLGRVVEIFGSSTIALYGVWFFYHIWA